MKGDRGKLRWERVGKNLLSQSELKEVLSYNETTGLFTWRTNMGNVKKGTVAGWNGQTKRLISIRKIRYMAARLVWLYVYGYFPRSYIFHKNGNPFDNRLSNLTELKTEATITRYSPTKYKGLDFDTRKNEYRLKSIGRFKTKEEAFKAIILNRMGGNHDSA